MEPGDSWKQPSTETFCGPIVDPTSFLRIQSRRTGETAILASLSRKRWWTVGICSEGQLGWWIASVARNGPSYGITPGILQYQPRGPVAANTVPTREATGNGRECPSITVRCEIILIARNM
ncbi:hypothetical protein COCNU_11G007260 [Cocos nucifera]|uniref:Uncharacterized protein n=1 Tax=Cocos nucifera TaxID=13894 RepID=A0A8K0IQW6_COCNU|nr:hypothetical protein COCNU_11G007260 [Cocos nucifera]